jgi:chromosome segregation ATPase
MNNYANNNEMNQDAKLEQELNGLRRQYEQLRDQKVRTEQQVTDLTGRLETLKAQAEAEYGTSEPKELQSLLQEKRMENERVVAEYREHIKQIHADLASVENSVEGNR